MVVVIDTEVEYIAWKKNNVRNSQSSANIPMSCYFNKYGSNNDNSPMN